MTEDSTSSFIYCTPKSYQQDIFQKTVLFFFLVLCEFHGWSAEQNQTFAPAFRNYVLFFQPLFHHSELFHSQFGSITSVLAL